MKNDITIRDPNIKKWPLLFFFFHSRKNVDSRQEETMLTGAMRREKQKKT